MGKIKSKAIKMTAKRLKESGVPLEDSFNKNKKVLGTTMPSKKIRNQLAGYMTRMKKIDNKEQEKMLKKSH